MNTIRLKSGMASKYFLTDPDTMTAIVEKPYLVFSKREIGIHVLSEILAIINTKNRDLGFFNSFRKKFTIEECEINLKNLYESKKNDFPNISKPIVIFSPIIDKKTLVIMKMLKVRGVYSLLAIQSNEVESLEAIIRESEDNKIKDGFDFAVYGPVNFNIVSSITETIVSKQIVQQILTEFGGLIVKFDPKDELFFEGLQPE